MAEKFLFAPALRENVAAKIAMFGPSGAGKTTAAILLAYGLTGDWRRVALIDTEGDSGTQLSGHTIEGCQIPNDQATSFFRTGLAPPYGPVRMSEVIKFTEQAVVCPGCGKPTQGAEPGAKSAPPCYSCGGAVPTGAKLAFDAVVFDSLSHVWSGAGGTLEMVDKIGRDGWKQMTPLLRTFIDTLRLSRLHVVAPMRAKTDMEYVTAEDSGGKKRVVEIKKLGIKADMREGVDYEFTVVFSVRMDHTASCDKDRTHLFADRPPQRLNVETGRLIREWCRGGVSEIGSHEWVVSKLETLRSYGGSLEGLKTLWSGVATHVGRLSVTDFAALTLAKDEGKARLIAAAKEA